MASVFRVQRGNQSLFTAFVLGSVFGPEDGCDVPPKVRISLNYMALQCTRTGLSTSEMLSENVAAGNATPAT
jgi:hypothetical protein